MILEHNGRLIEIQVFAPDVERDPDDAWTYMLECWDVSYHDGEGELFTVRCNEQGRLLVETMASAVDVSVIEAAASIAERELPERYRWAG